MKILHVAPVRFDRPNGVSVYVTELIKSIAKLGLCEIGLLSTVPSKDSILNDMPRCIILEGPSKSHCNPWFLSEKWKDRIIDKFGVPDIVHFHDIYDPFEVALAHHCVKKGWKYVFSPHGCLQKEAQMRKPFKKMLGNALFFNEFMRNAWAVHALNETEAMSVRRMSPHANVFVVPNGVPDDILHVEQDLFSNRTTLSSEGVALIVGFIGRIDIYHKGFDLLFQALRIIEKRHEDVNMKLFIIGPFCAKDDELKLFKLISALTNPHKVTLGGVLSGKEKWKALSDFDIFIHTSRFEGMPTAVIEAMAFGKPCIITPGTNMQNLILECQGGWAVDFHPEAIADILISLSKDRFDIERRGVNAQNYVRQHLLWSRIGQQYCEDISSMLKEK